ncbi:MAG: FHA domain-containing protein, partial [Acidobacteria bacterium]|nr:FHA domain-containing protein [Acidobacteriota bacterium]
MGVQIRLLYGGSPDKCFPLSEAVTNIGRDDENQIQINHSSISRKHCVIRRTGNVYTISDLKSLNGTYVKNRAVHNTALAIGDKIQIGDFTAVFESTGTKASFAQTSSILDAKLRLPPDYVMMPLRNSLAVLTGELSALLAIARQISVIQDIKELLNEILEQIFLTIPADQGAVILTDDNLEFVDVTAVNRTGREAESRISKTIVGRVLTEGAAILAADVAQDERKIGSESLAIAGTLSLLCVPLILFDKTIGAIYLTTTSANDTFDETHLRFVTAVSSIAAVAIENVRNLLLLKNENVRLKAENLLRTKIIGESEPMQSVFDCIAKSAPTDSTVLITGESGTGK